jgi:tRNA uridine 5-carbamoylmethylation protein Kti12
MSQVKKLFFVPVGLPGMGKSTLAKHIRQATQNHLQGQNQIGSKRDYNQAFS